MNTDVWNFLIAAGAIQGLLLSISLLRVSPASSSSRLLAALVACFAFILGEEFLDVSGLQRSLLPHTTGLTISFELLIGPLALFYARALVERFRPSKIDLLHFVPFVLASLLFLPFYLQNDEAKFASLDSDPRRAFFGLVGFKAAFLFAYLIWTLRLLHAKRAEIQEAGEAARLAIWYRRTIAIAFGFGAVSFGIYLLGRFGLDLRVDSDRFSAAVLTTALYGIAFVSIAQSRFLQSVDSQAPIGPRSAKYQTSPLTDETARVLCEQVLAYFETEEPYRDGDCSLQSIARGLGVPAHHVSQILNQQLGTSFNEWINHYRVQAAKASLADPESGEETILGVAFAAGFNSKASFNRVFKKHTGMTPSQFRRDADRKRSLNP